jgi:Ser-tRNA(Ala) deacylase AlaX
MFGFTFLVAAFISRCPRIELRSNIRANMYLSNPRLFEARTTLVNIVPVTAQEAKESKVPGDLVDFVTHKVVLEDSLFHPQGGGQPSDKGTLISSSGDVFQVLFAASSNKSGPKISEHYGHLSTTAAASEGITETALAMEKLDVKEEQLNGKGVNSFKEGQEVKMIIDANLRQLNARLHSAGHTIDAALKRCEGDIFNKLKATKGYHFIEGPYVEYEGEISEKELKELPDMINKHMKDIITENIATSTWMAEKKDASTLLNLSEEELQFYPENVRIVEVAGTVLTCSAETSVHIMHRFYLFCCEIRLNLTQL